nr:hypothetical protein GCM10025730_16530 [Promicromonospora thailandica]
MVLPSARATVSGAVTASPEPGPAASAGVPVEGSGVACAVVAIVATSAAAANVAAAFVRAGAVRRSLGLMGVDTTSGRDTSQDPGRGGFTAWRDSARVGRPST